MKKKICSIAKFGTLITFQKDKIIINLRRIENK